ncbi:MurR/RpiR family transcriptional regulator [soil metagenome]
MTQTAPSAGALARLRSGLDYLTPALKRLATVVLESPEETIYQSVTELAELGRVGEASVIRLCRDLGFKGFQDFKLALAADLALSPRAETSKGTGDLAGILESVTASALQAVQETKALLDLGVLEAVVTALLKADHILVYGAGASGVTARDFGYKFLRLGYSVNVLEDAHLAAMTATTLPGNAVMIGISRSGSTIDTVRALELAQARGVTTVAVSQRAKSPATAVADYTLFTASSESPLTGGSIPSKLGQLLLLDALFAALLARRDGAESAVAATAKAVTDRNY